MELREFAISPVGRCLRQPLQILSEENILAECMFDDDADTDGWERPCKVVHTRGYPVHQSSLALFSM
jgi:hypothetical protein